MHATILQVSTLPLNTTEFLSPYSALLENESELIDYVGELSPERQQERLDEINTYLGELISVKERTFTAHVSPEFLQRWKYEVINYANLIDAEELAIYRLKRAIERTHLCDYTLFFFGTDDDGELMTLGYFVHTLRNFPKDTTFHIGAVLDYHY